MSKSTLASQNCKTQHTPEVACMEHVSSLGSPYLVSDFSKQCVALNNVYSIKFDKVAISKWVTA
jgi:hypothetical protein